MSFKKMWPFLILVLGVSILFLTLWISGRSADIVSGGKCPTVEDFKQIFVKQLHNISGHINGRSVQAEPGSLTVSGNPIPNQDILKQMSEKELELFFHRYISSPQTTCLSVERMGKLTDGGWEVCLDPRYAPDPNGCLVYSFGINYKFSFDDAVAKYGCEVHSFDPSMTRTKDHKRSQRVFFHLEGLGAQDGPIQFKNATWQIYTLATIRKRLRHQVRWRRVDMVKMDVERAEFWSLPQAFKDGSLADVRQVAFELHGARKKSNFLANFALLRECYENGLRIYTTNRNPGCEYLSRNTGMPRSSCHEVYMLNVNLAR